MKTTLFYQTGISELTTPRPYAFKFRALHKVPGDSYEEENYREISTFRRDTTVSPTLIQRICLFALMLYVPVNSNGHVGKLPPFYRTFIQH